MGLAERRAAKEYETKHLPRLKQEIVQAAGFEVPIEINWESLSAPDQAHLYEECWTKVYFTPLIGAFKAICVDDLGKDALKGSLKKIVITNTAGIYYGDRMASFMDGVLTLNHEPTTNVDSIEERQKGIQKTLEAAL
ncbi:MAG TPA: hypothetical protein VKN99_20320 [Polyangia bacterium]|nr:hypothetical protein [Polyangia bacterium]